MLVQVAVAMIVLIGFTAFVADYGLMWVARRQAQNAADAGALAGAIALAYDDFADHSSAGPAKQSAHNVALGNLVAAEAPKVDIDADVYFYPDAPAKFPAECADDTCIRVDVYRNQVAGNPLPVWFGQLIGLVNQGVQATAIARASFGNASDCLKPWAVVDKWDENWEDGAPNPLTWEETMDPEFDKYLKSGDPDPSITSPDVYTPASVDVDAEGNPNWSTYDPGTGFHPFTFSGGSVSGYAPDYGRQISLKLGSPGDWRFGSGWFMRLNLAPFDTDEDGTSCTANGAKCYREHIKGCVGVTWAIGDEIMIDNSPGSATGPTRDAVGGPDIHTQDPDSLYNQDRGAYWDQTLNGGRGGIAGSCCASSPRIVAIPLVNPDALMAAFKNGNNTVPIGNIAGFFVEGVSGNGGSQVVTGRLVTLPGLKTDGEDDETPSTFMVNISLIR
jgi:hypothetical protein